MFGNILYANHGASRLVLFWLLAALLKPRDELSKYATNFVSRQICKVAARTAPMTGALKLLPQQSLNKLGLSIVNPNLIWSSLARPCKAQKSEAVSTQPRNMYLPLGTMQGDSPSRNAKRSLAYILTTTPMSSIVPISFYWCLGSTKFILLVLRKPCRAV